eukprot:Blabericola_migrator_1__4209@NODE_2290_length_2992_cov_83_159316_g1438_i0_p1_GENE_NODE_2290_length_2992_cov_83_159316_g1438_i0NODE_2290_length_2992_cov_83_159316_g1438_i0_p1_ORF_typecomplete_len928_score87_72PFK/PF00365_20/24PFK/PF00365_20/5_1e20_NODE_2290_length_2992_cov_83_159316_g1438_i0532836
MSRTPNEDKWGFPQEQVEKLGAGLLNELSVFDDQRLNYRPPLPAFLAQSTPKGGGLMSLRATVEDYEETRYIVTADPWQKSKRFVMPGKTARMIKEVMIWVSCELRSPGISTAICALYERIILIAPNARVQLAAAIPALDNLPVRDLNIDVIQTMWNQYMRFLPVDCDIVGQDRHITHLFVFRPLHAAGYLEPVVPPPEIPSGCKMLFIPVPNYSALAQKTIRFALGSDSLARAKADQVGRLSNRIDTCRKEYHIVLEPLVRDRVCATAELIKQIRATLIIDPLRRYEEALSDLARFVKMREMIGAPYGLILWCVETGMVFGNDRKLPITTESPTEDVEERRQRIYMEKVLRPGIIETLKDKTFSKICVHCFPSHCRVMPTNFDCYYGQALGHSAAVCMSLRPRGEDSLVMELSCPGTDPSDPGWKLSAYVPRTGYHPFRLSGSRPHVTRALISRSARHRVLTFNAFLETIRADLNVWYLKDLLRNAGPIQYPDTTVELPAFLRCGAPFDTNLSVAPSVSIAELPEEWTRASSPYSPANLSPLEFRRLRTPSEVPSALRGDRLEARAAMVVSPSDDQIIQTFFPLQAQETSYPQILRLRPATFSSVPVIIAPMKVGVLIAGELGAGINNVVCGLQRWCKRYNSTLLAFPTVCDLVNRESIVFHKFFEVLYNNRTGAGWRRIPARDGSLPQEMQRLDASQDAALLLNPSVVTAAAFSCQDLELDGLVVCGSRLGLSGAARLTEACLERGIRTAIVCVPCSYENDIESPFLECCLGWDTVVASNCTDISLQSLGDGTWLFATMTATSWSPSNPGTCGTTTMEVGLRCHADFIIIPEIYEEQNLQDLARRGFKTRIDALIADLASVMRDTPEPRDGLICVPADTIDRVSNIKVADLLRRGTLTLSSTAALAEWELWPPQVKQRVTNYQVS